MHSVTRRKKGESERGVVVEGIPFKEAFLLVWDYRSKDDGYYYRIG